MKPYLVLDTNIILLDATHIITLGKDYTIVLPETVLDEIESIDIDTEFDFMVAEMVYKKLRGIK